MNSNKPFDNKVVCDLCGYKFKLTPGVLKEEEVVLTKQKGALILTRPAVITYLICPSCGKRYPVIVDDSQTLPILEELKETLQRRMKYSRRGAVIPKKLETKYQRLNKKLDFKRQQLAEEFSGAVYQSDGNTIQLDYRYHAR